ncbi:hypothetical protein Q1695_004023 [Nippostrongylus brasiliensis]|nr:hypothetical protein Q1695_004023 [Nippostrongylus brasiliensis]
MVRSLVVITLMATYMVDARLRRQADDDESDLTISGWDPTIRDRFKDCDALSSFAPTSEQYCKMFTMCCTMQFDPRNGDKCQVKDERCVPLPEGGADAVCIHRNCTEMITTTTTTTTTTPEPTEAQHAFNAAGGFLFDITIV